MPHFVVDKIQNALNDHSKALKGSHVHVLGVAYKRDIDDVRESPALDIIHLLGKRGASVTYSDPYVPQLHADGVVPDMSAIDADKGAHLQKAGGAHDLDHQIGADISRTDDGGFDFAGLCCGHDKYPICEFRRW